MRTSTPPKVQSHANAVVDLSIDALCRGRYQPRRIFKQQSLKQLAATFAVAGILQPIIVREIARQQFEIISGERRWRAAQIAGFKVVPCLIRSYDEHTASMAAVIENLQREDLSPLEEAKSYQRLLIEFADQHNQSTLAKALGIRRTKIAKLLRLLDLPAEIQELILAGSLDETQGQELLRLPSDTDRCNFAKRSDSENWTVAQLHQEIDRHLQPKASKKSNPADNTTPQKTFDWLRTEEQCSKHLGFPMKINPVADSFEIVIRVRDTEECQAVFEKLGYYEDA